MSQPGELPNMLIYLAPNTKNTRLTRERYISLFPHHRGTENAERVLFCPIGRLCDEGPRTASLSLRYIYFRRMRGSFSLARACPVLDTGSPGQGKTLFLCGLCASVVDLSAPATRELWFGAMGISDCRIYICHVSQRAYAL
jgi:hypothetical protein